VSEAGEEAESGDGGVDVESSSEGDGGEESEEFRERDLEPVRHEGVPMIGEWGRGCGEISPTMDRKSRSLHFASPFGRRSFGRDDRDVRANRGNQDPSLRSG